MPELTFYGFCFLKMAQEFIKNIFLKMFGVTGIMLTINTN